MKDRSQWDVCTTGLSFIYICQPVQLTPDITLLTANYSVDNVHTKGMQYLLYQCMCYTVCRMVHIKDPLPLIRKSSPCSHGNGFPLTLSEWSFTIHMSDTI